MKRKVRSFCLVFLMFFFACPIFAYKVYALEQSTEETIEEEEDIQIETTCTLEVNLREGCEYNCYSDSVCAFDVIFDAGEEQDLNLEISLIYSEEGRVYETLEGDDLYTVKKDSEGIINGIIIDSEAVTDKLGMDVGDSVHLRVIVMAKCGDVIHESGWEMVLLRKAGYEYSYENAFYPYELDGIKLGLNEYETIFDSLHCVILGSLENSGSDSVKVLDVSIVNGSENISIEPSSGADNEVDLWHIKGVKPGKATIALTHQDAFDLSKTITKLIDIEVVSELWRIEFRESGSGCLIPCGTVDITATAKVRDCTIKGSGYKDGESVEYEWELITKEVKEGSVQLVVDEKDTAHAQLIANETLDASMNSLWYRVRAYKKDANGNRVEVASNESLVKVRDSYDVIEIEDMPAFFLPNQPVVVNPVLYTIRPNENGDGIEKVAYDSERVKYTWEYASQSITQAAQKDLVELMDASGSKKILEPDKATGKSEGPYTITVLKEGKGRLKISAYVDNGSSSKVTRECLFESSPLEFYMISQNGWNSFKAEESHELYLINEGFPEGTEIHISIGRNVEGEFVELEGNGFYEVKRDVDGKITGLVLDGEAIWNVLEPLGEQRFEIRAYAVLNGYQITDVVYTGKIIVPMVDETDDFSDTYPDVAAKDCKRRQFAVMLWRAAGCPEPENKEIPFSDVCGDYTSDRYSDGWYSTYCDAVAWAYYQGYITRINELDYLYNYETHGVLSKATVLMYLYEAAGAPDIKNVNLPFQDVSEDDWYYKYVCWAYSKGLISGGAEFEADENCTLGEAHWLLERMFGEIPMVGKLSLPGELEMTEGIAYQIHPEILPEKAQNNELKWNLSSHFSWNQENEIVANEAGAGTITVRSADGSELQAHCLVTIKIPGQKNMTLDRNSLTIDVGEQYTVSVSEISEEFVNNEVVWESANPLIASVSQDGTITGVSNGKTSITASIADDCYAICEVWITGPYDLKCDGFPVLNNMESFGYASTDNGFKIEKDVYRNVYGPWVIEEIYDQIPSAWNGNCFGMSIMSAFLAKGYRQIASYTPDILTANPGGYYEKDVQNDETILKMMERLPSGKINFLQDQIERYQVWMESAEWRQLYQEELNKYDTTKELFENTLTELIDNDEVFVVFVSWRNDVGKMLGHTMVTDTCREPENLGDGWTKIYVYDPNYPYYGGFDENDVPHPAYAKALDRFILVNTETGEWKMDVGLNSDSDMAAIGYDDSGNRIKDSVICFIAPESFPRDFYPELPKYISEDDTVKQIEYNTNDISINDENGNILYQLVDGEVQYVNSDVVLEMPNYGTSSTQTTTASGKLILPKAKYSVCIKDGYISSSGNNGYTGVAVEDEVVIDYSLKQGISVSSQVQTSVDVLLLEQENNTSVSMTLMINGSSCETFIQDGKLTLRSDEEQAVDISVKTDGEEKVIDQVVVNKDAEVVHVLENNPYVDVTSVDWFYKSVLYAYANKVMVGTDATHFSPNANLTRGQFALILYRLEGEEVVETEKSFADIVGNEWYGQAVLWAAEKGIVTGYQDGSFGPNDNITREQMIVMMYRYGKYLGKDLSAAGEMDFFEDATTVGSYATEAMKWAIGSEIIKGKTETKLEPQGNTTRAEGATIIQRFMQK